MFYYFHYAIWMTLLLDLEFQAKRVAGTWMIQPLNGEKIMDQKYFLEKPLNLTTFFLDNPPFFKATIILKKHPKYYPCLSWTNCFFWMNFKQDFNCIFKTKAGNENKYRFVFQDIYLVAEHLRLNPLLWICWWPKKGYFHTER